MHPTRRLEESLDEGAVGCKGAAVAPANLRLIVIYQDSRRVLCHYYAALLSTTKQGATHKYISSSVRTIGEFEKF